MFIQQNSVMIDLFATTQEYITGRRLSDEAPIATKMADLEAKINELEATNVELKAKNDELEAKLAAAAQQRGAAASAYIARREMNELEG